LAAELVCHALQRAGYSVWLKHPYKGVELVRRYRAGQADERVQRGIHISINGIAAGLRNTG
jgi:phosphoenolpyruvate carboxylase